MDWQNLVGLDFTVVFGLLAFGVKDVPQWVAWPGMTIGLLLIVWGILPIHDHMRSGPALLFIACAAGIVSSVFWQLDTSSDTVGGPKILFPKFALYWVEVDENFYQIGVVTKLFNMDH